MSDDTKLNDTDRAELIQALRNATPMGRFNPSETAAVLAFMEDAGYVITKQDKAKPVVELAPEPEPIKPNATLEGNNASNAMQAGNQLGGQSAQSSGLGSIFGTAEPAKPDPVKPVV